MFSIRLLLSSSYDPYFNLSLENYIFHNIEENQYILFLWRNYNTVVIGRAQNPWKECNTRRMERDSIRLARRNTGGGAVFHDLGNTCFTFMSRKNKIQEDNDFFIPIILDALQRLNISAFLYGRNDIVVQTSSGKRKISGSAYRQTNWGKLHHGTILLHTNLDKLTYYLTPDDKKLETKGISSVRSRVLNLVELKSDINYEILCQSLKKSFSCFFNQKVIPEIISSDYFLNNSIFFKVFLKQSSWAWNFGSVPNFKHQMTKRFTFGDVLLYFDIEKGIISRTRIFTDSLHPDPLEELSCNLTNLVYNSKDVQLCCQKWMKKWSQYPELSEVSTWLIKNIS